MRAARLHAPGDLRIEDVPKPVPGPGEVLVQIEVALTDGTDLKTYRRGHPRARALVSGAVRARVLRATSTAAASSRRTRPRAARATAARATSSAAALEFLAGAYADWLVVPERIAAVNLLDVPAGLASDVAALVEPLACCLRGVERAGVTPGDTVAILGAGPIGLMLVRVRRRRRRRPVLVGGRAGAAGARGRVRRRSRATGAGRTS